MANEDRDGGVTYHAPSADQLQRYQEAYAQVAGMQPPQLFDASNRNDRLFVAAFDGTGNDGDKAVEGRSNVAEIASQYKEIALRRITDGDTSGTIAMSYLEGPGTQAYVEPGDGRARTWGDTARDAAHAVMHPIETAQNAYNRASLNVQHGLDQASGGTFQQRLDTMYERLNTQAQAWYQENPAMRLTLADMGFSRGAEQAAGFARMVHDKGLWVTDRDGQEVNLIATGQVRQAVALFDPVGTGKPWEHDRSLPPSVVTGIQLRAQDEQRDQFKDTTIVQSDGAGFLHVNVPGAHSDVGGGYGFDGLPMLNGNLMRTYLNKVTGGEMLQSVDVGRDYVGKNEAQIHHSHEGVVFSSNTFSETGERASVANDVRTPSLLDRARDIGAAASVIDQNLGTAFDRKLHDGASYVGNKAYDGAAYVGNKAYDGAAYVGNKAYDGANYVATKIQEGTGALYGYFAGNAGTAVSEREQNLFRSAQQAVVGLNNRLNVQDSQDHVDRIAAYSALGAQRVGADLVDRLELSDDRRQVIVIGTNQQRFQFGIQDALRHAPVETMQRVAHEAPQPQEPQQDPQSRQQGR